MTHEIERPIIIVHKIEGGAVRFEISISEMLDPANMIGPVIPGILLSDLLDHLAHAYHQMVPDRAEQDIRADILKAMRDEDRFKKNDPSRSGMAGGLVRQ